MMKYSSFEVAGTGPTWGVAHDDELFDLGPSGLNLAPSLRGAIVNGTYASPDLAWQDAPRVAASDVTFLPPIPDPGKILCIGMNYTSHQAETGRDRVPAPTVFTRFADSQMGHLQPAVRPLANSLFDYEGELALVISKPAYRVDQADAFDFIAGYSVYNDFSVRDWQRATSQWTPGKNFPSTGAFGPYLVPPGDLGDIALLRLETSVNGEVRQSASIADLTFTIPEIIAHVSTFTPLSPGDVIVTGTPGGVGFYRDPQSLLSAGDLVEVAVSDIGVLSNTVVQG